MTPDIRGRAHDARVSPAQLTLCADDFGLTPGISSGIAQLAGLNRLSWISCITNSDHWYHSAVLLARRASPVQLGLHVNLTEGRPLSGALARLWPSLPSLPELILRAHAGLLPRAQLRMEIDAQLAAFRRVVGHPPRFVDGHQHVHHLPGIRDIVLDLVGTIEPTPVVRSAARMRGPGFAFKRWAIEVTGARRLRDELRRRRIPHNHSLSGAYDFREPDYRGLMQAWLRRLPPTGALLFCHPAQVSEGEIDSITAARLREFAYLASDDFLQDLADANVCLSVGSANGFAAPKSATVLSEMSTSG